VDVHGLIGRGEGEGVLDELGQQVRQLGHGAAADPPGLDLGQGDPSGLLDLAHGGLHEFEAAGGHAADLGAAFVDEDEQALGVAAHTGREVVEFEELGQRLGVELLLFEGGDEGQLRAHESLAAAAEAGQ
jgi:hypothetical protein